MNFVQGVALQRFQMNDWQSRCREDFLHKGIALLTAGQVIELDGNDGREILVTNDEIDLFAIDLMQIGMGRGTPNEYEIRQSHLRENRVIRR